MPRPLVIPDVVRMSILGRWSGARPVVTVLHYDIGNTAEGVSRRDAIDQAVADVIQNWQSQVMAFLANNYSIEGLAWVDLNSEDGATGIEPPNSGENLTGIGTGTTLPPNAAILVTKNQEGGRGTKSGRMYLPPLSEAYYDEQGLLVEPGQLTFQQGKMDTFLANITQAQPPDDYDGHLVVPHVPLAPDDEVTAWNGTSSHVTSLTVQQLLATQRRRLRP